MFTNLAILGAPPCGPLNPLTPPCPFPCPEDGAAARHEAREALDAELEQLRRQRGEALLASEEAKEALEMAEAKEKVPGISGDPGDPAWWLIPLNKWVITPVIYMGFL